ncbi:MAG: hypothetical protein GY711_12845 [bacterium]|nr:hypothetical protein [bacterium]
MRFDSFAWKRSSPLHAAVSTVLLVGLAQSAGAQGGVYQENNGLIVVEIESTPAVGQWQVQTNHSGYTYDSYYRWNGPDLFGSPGNSTLRYEIQVEQGGNWELAIHNRHNHPDDTEENDVWSRMDGGPWFKTFSNGSGTVSNWNWDTRFDVGSQPDANWNLSPGVHVLEFSARSHGFMMDRFHLYLAGHPDQNNTQAPESTARLGDNFCPAAVNSSGVGGDIQAWGSAFADKQDLRLRAIEMPANQFGYFLASRTQSGASTPPGSSGNLCLGNQEARFTQSILFTGSTGEFDLVVDTANIPTNPPRPIVAGETWNFQGWFRDYDPTLTSNFTHAVEVRFQ